MPGFRVLVAAEVVPPEGAPVPLDGLVVGLGAWEEGVTPGTGDTPVVPADLTCAGTLAGTLKRHVMRLPLWSL